MKNFIIAFLFIVIIVLIDNNISGLDKEPAMVICYNGPGDTFTDADTCFFTVDLYEQDTIWLSIKE